jgi:hypothetical protein
MRFQQAETARHRGGQLSPGQLQGEPDIASQLIGSSGVHCCGEVLPVQANAVGATALLQSQHRQRSKRMVFEPFLRQGDQAPVKAGIRKCRQYFRHEQV